MVRQLTIDTARRWTEKYGTVEEQELKAWEDFQRIKPGGKIIIRRPAGAQSTLPHMIEMTREDLGLNIIHAAMPSIS